MLKYLIKLFASNYCTLKQVHFYHYSECSVGFIKRKTLDKMQMRVADDMAWESCCCHRCTVWCRKPSMNTMSIGSYRKIHANPGEYMITINHIRSRCKLSDLPLSLILPLHFFEILCLQPSRAKRFVHWSWPTQWLPCSTNNKQQLTSTNRFRCSRLFWGMLRHRGSRSTDLATLPDGQLLNLANAPLFCNHATQFELLQRQRPQWWAKTLKGKTGGIIIFYSIYIYLSLSLIIS